MVININSSVDNLISQLEKSNIIKDLNEYQIITIKDFIQKAYNEGHANGFAAAKNELKTN